MDVLAYRLVAGSADGDTGIAAAATAAGTPVSRDYRLPGVVEPFARTQVLSQFRAGWVRGENIATPDGFIHRFDGRMIGRVRHLRYTIWAAAETGAKGRRVFQEHYP